MDKYLPKLDFSSYFYKNCVRNRRNDALICQEYPFRVYIEEQEKHDIQRKSKDKK